MSEHEKTTDPAGGSARPLDLEAAIREKILQRDSRYDLAAYLFIYEALAFTQRSLGRDDPRLKAGERHVSGRELLDGIRRYAGRAFGPLAPVVFRSWGVHRTEGFGEIVFNLVQSDLLAKTDSDQREDFADGFDLDTAFDGPLEVRIE